MRKPLRHGPFCVAWCLIPALSLFFVRAASSRDVVPNRPQDEPLAREIFVPFEDLNVLLDGDARRVFLTRDEYENLLREARRSPSVPAPQATAVLSASYDATIADQRALITGNLVIEVLAPGLRAIPLDLSGVGVLAATWDDQPASLGRDPQGRVVLFVRDVGEHRLRLDLVTPLRTSAAQQSLQFEVPAPATTQFRLTAPGNVEVRSGAAVITRQVEGEGQRTRFELQPARGPLALVLSLNNRQLLEQRVVLARGVVVDEVTQAYERLHATLSFEVLHGAVNAFRLRPPAGFEVTEVTSPMLSRWAVQSIEGGEPTLDVELREPVTGAVQLRLTAVKNQVTVGPWTLPRVDILDVANQVSVLGLLLEDRLSFDSLQATGLIPLDNNVLAGALPDSARNSEPGAPSVRLANAWFSATGEYSLAAQLSKPAASLSASSATMLRVGQQQLEARGTITVAPRMEKLFALTLLPPADWRVERVTNEAGESLPFELAQPAEDGGQRLLVRLPSGVAPGSTWKLAFEARSVPAGWLEAWEDARVAFPAFRLAETSDTTGAIAVEVEADLSARPETTQNLTPLAERERASLGLTDAEGTLAYQFYRGDYAATFAIHRDTPRATASTFSFLRIQPTGLTARYELLYDIRRARTKRLVFSLPESTPASLTIQGLGDVQVQEYSYDARDGRRVWTAALASATEGVARLAVEFEQPLPDQETVDQSLPIIRAEEVAHQSAIVAVEGSPEFDVQVAAEGGRKVDVGELAEAEYQVGRRLLGAYGFTNEPQVSVTIAQRPGYALPSAITQRAELTTIVSTSRRAQTVARYKLFTKAAYLAITMPPGAELWSVTIDDRPASPQVDGRDLVIGLPPRGDSSPRDLRIVYETSDVRAGLLLTNLETVAPRLELRTESDERYAVPTADAIWNLYVPRGYRLLRVGGTVHTDNLTAGTSPLKKLGAILCVLGGGVRPFGWLPAGGYPRSAATAIELSDSMAYSDEEFEPPAAVVAPQIAESAEEDAAKRLPESTEGLIADAEAETAANEPAGGRPARRLVQGDAAGRHLGLAAANPVSTSWALEGVRSLRIALDHEGRVIRFRGLGDAPTVRATLAPDLRLRFLAAVLALMTLGLGVARTRQSTWRKARFILAVMVGAVVLPLGIGLLTRLECSTLFEPAFFAAAALAPYYLLVGAARGLGRVAGSWGARNAVAAGIGCVLLLGVTTASPAQETAAPEVDVKDLLLLLRPEQPIKLPADAIIIPYDPADPAGPSHAEKVLVPYDQYTRLWNLAFPDKPVNAAPPPASHALADARYEATLTDGNYLAVTGELTVDVFSEKPLEIPLPLGAAVLEEARLDGRPARLRIVEPQTVPPQPRRANQAAEQPPRPADSLVTLYVDRAGRRRLTLTARVPLSRSGGWRIARANLPTAMATSLTLRAPAANTEVRLSGVADRTAWETQAANESIVTTLPEDGTLGLQWRPAVAAAQVDQSLTARSMAVLDVQEDGVRLTWSIQLESPRSQRETYTLLAPADYRVEKITGDNVRSWKTRINEQGQLIDITLLKAASGAESFTLSLTRREAIGLTEVVRFAAPVVSAPDALLHQGNLVIRRGPLLDLRVERAVGLTRAEVADDAVREVLAAIADESPLVVRAFQSHRFSATPFTLELSARAFQPQVSSETRSLLRITDRALLLESRLLLNVSDRPLHQLDVAIPDNLDVSDLRGENITSWAVTGEPSSRRVTVYFSQGVLGAYALDLVAQQTRQGADDVEIPRMQVTAANRRSGSIVVQVDPSVDVDLVNASGLDRVALSSVQAWLADDQRAVARLVLRHGDADYSGALRVTPRTPNVSVFSVTNVRVTPTEIEDTIFIRYAIRDAGIRRVSFQIPAGMRDAEIAVPLLRQKTIEEVAGDASRVRVLLELQDDIMNELIVLVRGTRALSGEDITAHAPVLETGTVVDRFVVLENAGRDEVVVSVDRDFEELNRQTNSWRRLAAVLPGHMTQAYAARPSVVAPRLVLSLKQRTTVETVTARVGLAETLMVVDSDGAYRAEQIYRVDNKTEQFLEVELPPGADLWTTVVAEEPVKPTRGDPNNSRLVRVPLIKTQVGDADYTVRLKYGGHLGHPSLGRQVSFPLIHTTQIRVERSQVRLWLPEAQHWNWLPFGGTLSRVDQSELTADRLSYETKQLRELMDIARGNSDEFARMRAQYNLSSLLSKAKTDYGDPRSARTGAEGAKFFRELQANTATLDEVRQQTLDQTPDDGTSPLEDNRDQLENLFRQQGSTRSNQVAESLGRNFAAPSTQPGAAGDKAELFNNRWLEANALSSTLDSPQEVLPGQSLARDAERKVAEKLAKPNAINFEEFSGKEMRGQPQTADTKQRQDVLQRQIERYQQQLESQNAAQPARPASPSTMSGARMDGPTIAGESTASPNAGFAGGGYGGAGGGLTLADDNLDGVIDMRQAPATGLASLDVELPRRGVEYLFTTPGGDIALTARPIDSEVAARLLAIVRLLAVVALILVAVRVARAVWTRLNRLVAGVSLMLLGLISVIAWILPIAGLIALVAGVTVAVRPSRS